MSNHFKSSSLFYWVIIKKKLKHIKSELYKFGFDTLVVIFGVLIAFVLNDWNENRIMRDMEYKLLTDVRNNLISSRTNLENNIVYNKKTINGYEKILKYIKEDLPYSKSLDTAFSYFSYWADPQFTYTAYETLKQKGLDIVQNDSLKLLITKIYEEYFPYVLSEQKGEWIFHESLVLPFTLKNIQYLNSDVAKPNNFNDLKTSIEFINLMGLKMVTRKYTIQNAEKAIDTINSLIVKIENELNKD